VRSGGGVASIGEVTIRDSRFDNLNMAHQHSDPSATLVAVTDEARAALDTKPAVRMTAFPFKVGRESRQTFERLQTEVDRRLGGVPPLNDLYLLEPPSDSLHISREHLAIGYVDGRFFLVDRGSACGTAVAGARVGGDRTEGRVDLHDGDEIVIGGPDSPFIFRFHIDA
jgi:hypothetical protein